MSNRQQRRQTGKLQQNPKVKKATDKFAMELTKIFVDHFDKAAVAIEEGGEVDLNFNDESKRLFQEKGAEFGKFFEGFMSDVKNELHTKEKMQEQQKSQLRSVLKGN